MRQLVTDLSGVLLPFTHDGREGLLQAEFKYIPKSDIREAQWVLPINNGVTFVVLEKDFEAGKLDALFAFGFDYARKEYIVLDPEKKKRD